MFLARTRVRPGSGRPRLAGPPRKTRASVRKSEDSEEDYIIPEKTGHGKKRDAPEDDHSSAEDASDQDDQDDTKDAPQDGHDDTDGAEDNDADDADADADADADDTDADDADDADNADDAPQDGLGNPNVSGISPPLPADLVESVLAEHETHFHVVTSGTEVGIFTNKYVYHPHFVVFHLLTHYQEELQMHVSSVNTLRPRLSRHGCWPRLITPNASLMTPSQYSTLSIPNPRSTAQHERNGARI